MPNETDKTAHKPELVWVFIKNTKDYTLKNQP